MQPHPEHQQDHTHLGQFRRNQRVRHIARRKWANHHTRKQITRDQRQAQALRHEAKDEGKAKANGNGGDQGGVMRQWAVLSMQKGINSQTAGCKDAAQGTLTKVAPMFQHASGLGDSRSSGYEICMNLPVLTNAVARRIFLDAHALGEPPTGAAGGADLHALIDRIGFVQVDSINTVERAHHMILFARRQTYQQASLKRLLERDRSLWENWTHDASILPAHVFPHWKHRFARDRERLIRQWTGWQRHGFVEKFDDVLQRIADHGPVSSSDVGIGETRGKGGWWDWHPSKAALEYLWRTGQISVTRRDGFKKVYDLTERVLATHHCAPEPSEAETVAWACREALSRIAFGTSGEIAAYWGAVSPEAAKAWCIDAVRRGEVIEIMVEGADGTLRMCYARPDIVSQTPPEPPARVRILSPFDPALRDRKRTMRLFGFHYRIEVFVPEPQRQYGYYVFPVLEGAQLIGRIDAKAYRNDSTFRVRAFWPEPGVRMPATRVARLLTAVERLAGFAGCDRVEHDASWLRT